MDSVSPPERGGATFRHAEMLEMAFVLKFNKSLDRVLKGNIGRDSGHLEEIHLLDAAQLLVDEGNTAPEVFRTVSRSARCKMRCRIVIPTSHLGPAPGGGSLPGYRDQHISGNGFCEDKP